MSMFQANIPLLSGEEHMQMQKAWLLVRVIRAIYLNISLDNEKQNIRAHNPVIINTVDILIAIQ